MIITENLTIGGKDFTKKYSDKNVYIENENSQQYSEAIDLVDYLREYTETDIPIEKETGDLTVSDTLQMMNQMGVETDD
jgi:5-enolpyruvylshikimate-3-phosphate synthase